MEYEVIAEEEEEGVSSTKRKRNKVADPESWKANKRRKARATGQEYVTIRGIVVPGKRVQPKDCSGCKKKCNENFSEADRERIHRGFWELGDIEKQKLFISMLVEEVPIATKRTKAEESRRTITRNYSLRLGKKKTAVCQGFFVATLDISEGLIKNILKGRDDTSYFPRKDQRGKHRSVPRGRPEENKEEIRTHIQNYIQQANPNSQSQDLKRKKAKRNVVVELPAGVNIKRMYDSYVLDMQCCNKTPEKHWLYRDILTKEFNIRFEDPCSKKKPYAGGVAPVVGQEITVPEQMEPDQIYIVNL